MLILRWLSEAEWIPIYNVWYDEHRLFGTFYENNIYPIIIVHKTTYLKIPTCHVLSTCEQIFDTHNDVL